MGPIRLPALGLALLLLPACGGAAAEGGTTPADERCAPVRAEADRAVAALEACRRDAPTVAPWAHRERYDHALAEVRALQALAPQRVIEPAEAQAAADAYWELLDAVSPELTNHVSLDRAENAAEGILRERQGDPAVAATREAELALEDIQRALLPDAPPDPCAEPQAAADRAVASASDCR
jgi:hypothetical protein